MKKLDFKVKKNAVIFLLVVIIIAFGTFLISYISKENNAKDTQAVTTDNKLNDVKIDDTKNNSEEQVEVPEVGTRENKSESSTVDKPSENKAENSITETEKKENTVVKPEPPKEKPKTQDDTTNKSKVPTYTENEVKPKSQNTNNGGETNDKGQVYFPGFGWVDKGSTNKSKTITSSGDINKQVGKMD